MKITKQFHEEVQKLVPSVKPLQRGIVVEQFKVTSISDPQEFGPTAPVFLQGKHSSIVTGERTDAKGVVTTVSVSVISEDMKTAQLEAGIESYYTPGTPARAGTPAKSESYDLPDCAFSANGYNQKWELVN